MVLRSPCSSTVVCRLWIMDLIHWLTSADLHFESRALSIASKDTLSNAPSMSYFKRLDIRFESYFASDLSQKSRRIPRGWFDFTYVKSVAELKVSMIDWERRSAALSTLSGFWIIWQLRTGHAPWLKYLHTTQGIKYHHCNVTAGFRLVQPVKDIYVFERCFGLSKSGKHFHSV